MADAPASYDITSTFNDWLNAKSNDPAVVFLYRAQPAEPKKQIPTEDLDWIASSCSNEKVAFGAVDTRKVDTAFATLEVQTGTPKLAFVRKGKCVGTTLLNPTRAQFDTWIADRKKA